LIRNQERFVLIFASTSFFLEEMSVSSRLVNAEASWVIPVQGASRDTLCSGAQQAAGMGQP
jgi:hypothetical protein